MHVHTAGENLIVRRVVWAYNCSILSLMKATCIAHSNIALIKYWGNRDDALRLPMTASISFALDQAFTTTTVEFDAAFGTDQIELEGTQATGPSAARISRHLDLLRAAAQTHLA